MTDASVARLVEQADRMLGRREFEQALDAIFHGISINPSYIPLWLLKARAHIGLEQYEEADEALMICLLKNPRDVGANLYYLINTMSRDDIDKAEKSKRFGAHVEQLGEDLFGDILAEFAQRKEFPEYLSSLLEGWRKTNTPLDTVRSALQLYSGGHFLAAVDMLENRSTEGVKPELVASVRDLLETAAKGGDQSSLWQVERGTLVRNGDDIVITTPPDTQSFAWLRMSPGWRNVEATVSFAGDSENWRSLYLRYTSSDSYVRLTAEGERIYVQERVPDYGLSIIFEYPKSIVEGMMLRIALKNDRLTIQADGENLISDPLPISPVITDGRAALAVGNVGSREYDAEFGDLSIQRVDTNWVTLQGGETRDDLRVALDGGNATGLIVPLGGKDMVDTQVPSLLLMAAGSGVSTYALLREGSLNLEEMREQIRGLPAIMADRLWSGVIFQPARNTNWRDIATAVRDAAGRGLQAGLMLSPETAADLAGQKSDIMVDWVLFSKPDSIQPAVMRELTRFYLEALYFIPETKGEFSSILY